MAISFLSSSLFFFLCFHFSSGTQLIISNNCPESIWPGILATAGHQTPMSGGFHLPTAGQVLLDLPLNWSGRIWPRQGCSFDQTGAFHCQTGDCSGFLQCGGTGGRPPATLIEMTLGSPTSPLHYYDVSLVDGFNVPVSMVPLGGGKCGAAACEADLNTCCPANLMVMKGGRIVGCKSACAAASTDRYCCRGEFSDPGRCSPTVYGRFFKAICPRAYSYPFDDSTGLKTCLAPRYLITFCPPN